MGQIDEAWNFIAPAYLATFITFVAMGVVIFRRLRVWSRRAREEEHEEQAAE